MFSANSTTSTATSASCAPSENMYSALSISDVVRTEFKDAFEELRSSQQFVRHQDVESMVEKAIKKMLRLDPAAKNEMVIENSTSTTESEAVNKEALPKARNNSKLIVTNFELLEKRLNSLEKKVSALEQTRSITNDKLHRKKEKSKKEASGYPAGYQSEKNTKDIQKKEAKVAKEKPNVTQTEQEKKQQQKHKLIETQMEKKNGENKSGDDDVSSEPEHDRWYILEQQRLQCRANMLAYKKSPTTMSFYQARLP